MVKPDQWKVDVVKEFSTPQTKKQVREFLGLSGYYRKFIPGYSVVAVELTDFCSNEGSFQRYSESQFVYAHYVLSLSLQWFALPKFNFWHFLGMKKKEMGVVIYMYLKHSPDYIDFKYT